MSHSIIPPSSAHIWGATNGCTGWVQMSRQYPELESSVESDEGTAAHEIGADLITSYTTGGSLTFKQFESRQADNGVVFNEGMFDAADVYATDVRDVMIKTGVFGGENFGTEHHIHAKGIHELSEGTLDQFIFNAKNKHLYIWDFKYGHGVVEVFENWQLINYVKGLLEQIGVNGSEDQQFTVHFRIVQPRAFHSDGMIREWVVKASDLRSYFNILEMNAEIALGEDAKCVSGPHCKHCSARHVCKAALECGINLYEVVSQPTPQELSNQALSVQLSIIKRAKKQIELLETGFEEQVKSIIKSGEIVPGWVIKQGYGREKWDKPIAEVVAMGEMFEKDLKKPIEAITPVQARKLGIDDSIIKAYSVKPLSGLKVTFDDGSKTKQLFGDIK